MAGPYAGERPGELPGTKRHPFAANGAPLDIACGEWCLPRHEHRYPREPSVVAHLLKVAGAISFPPIVRGRHRSATAFSFVLCGVSSASFVRGSHEQDSLLPAGS
jgi:hypothetical protein